MWRWGRWGEFGDKSGTTEGDDTIKASQIAGGRRRGEAVDALHTDHSKYLSTVLGSTANIAVQPLKSIRMMSSGLPIRLSRFAIFCRPISFLTFL